jgi:hypothetical protein
MVKFNFLISFLATTCGILLYYFGLNTTWNIIEGFCIGFLVIPALFSDFVFLGAIAFIFVSWFFWTEAKFRTYYLSALGKFMGGFFVAALIITFHLGKFNLPSFENFIMLLVGMFNLTNWNVMAMKTWKMVTKKFKYERDTSNGNKNMENGNKEI